MVLICMVPSSIPSSKRFSSVRRRNSGNNYSECNSNSTPPPSHPPRHSAMRYNLYPPEHFLPQTGVVASK